MKSRTKDTLKIYYQHSKRYPLALFLAVIGLTGAIGTDIYKPFLYKYLFDYLANPTGLDPQRPIQLIFQIFLVSCVTWLLWRLTTVANNFFQPRVMSDLLNTCYEYLANHSYNFFNNTIAGSLARKVNRFADSFERIMDQLTWNFLTAFVNIGAILVVVYFRYPILAAAIVIWSIFYLITNYWFANFKLKYNLEKAEIDTQASGHLADTITNNLNLKLFGGTAKEVATYRSYTQRLFELRYFTWNLDVVAEGIQGVFMIILEVAILYIALGLWRAGSITVGDFALLQAYILQIFDRLWNVGRNIQRLYETVAEAEEMTEILNTPHEIVDKKHALDLKVSKGEISFEQVNFFYNPDRPILKDLSISIASQEKVALIGPSGGGKSTIVKVLMRFFDIQSGRILIDGHNTAEVTQESLRAQLSLVPQEPILFHRSLMENIRYARPNASDEEVYTAATLAHCHEFISRFPEGYHTLVGERGVKLSGGERQRVAIARAILKNAPILILDEATSSLDSESERLIQDALHTLMENKTTIVIAHRLSTIMQMDRIIVLEDGHITEEGKHEELVKASQGTYQKLWEIQAGGFN